MSIRLELEVVERFPHRVVLSVVLTPEDPVSVEGVSVELLDRDQQCLAPRLQLPISGQLSGPLATRCELRSVEPIPDSARVVAQVWAGEHSTRLIAPTEPCTGLVNHIWGIGRLQPRTNRKLRSLTPEQVAVFARSFPWLREGRPECACPPHHSAIVDAREAGLPDLHPTVDDDDVDDLAAAFDLSEEDADFLRELMAD